jgi:MFS family permease
VQQSVGQAAQGSYFGTLRLWSLMTAVLVQSAMGLLSDHSRLRWGRRRPFIFTGTILDLVILTVLVLIIGTEGTQGFILLFIIAILLQLSANTAHAGQQGLIPDLVPEDQRGRFSGVKALLELPIPLLFVSFTIARLISQGKMQTGIIVAMVVLAVCMLITMLVREKPVQDDGKKIDWTPFLRLLFMTITFTLIILVMGKIVQQIGILIRGIDIPIALITIMGISGLITMIISVGLGVWISIRISLGQEAQENQPYIWWVINRLAFLVGATNLSTFALFYLQARLGYVEEQAAQPASILMLIVGVFILIFALPSGWLADRFGHKRLVIVSGLLALIGTIIAILLPSLVFIYIGGSFIGAGMGIFFTANWALGTSLVPPTEAGRYLGISNLAGAGAGAVGAYIGGPIADYFTNFVPDAPGLGYILLFSIYGMLFLFSVFAVTRIRNNSQNYQAF